MCYWWVGLIGAGISAAGQSQAGEDAQATAERNARLGEMQADDELARGSQEEMRYRRQLAQVVGGQRAAIGARNVRRSGTALDLLLDTQQIGEEDALTIRNDAARSAWGLRAGAGEQRRYGASAQRQGMYGAGSTLLTGGAQAYGTWATR
jgi:lipoprotein-anchoring transpeptidase ErfK/SrfK